MGSIVNKCVVYMKWPIVFSRRMPIFLYYDIVIYY